MQALHDLLEDGIRFDPLYVPSYNSDHMPMTLCAMAGLGADGDALIAYRDDYSRILRPVEPGRPVRDWRTGIGDMTAYASLLALFRGEIAVRGREAVASDVLERCLAGIAMEAFHPLIRLGYAIEFESDPETAAALAYLVSAHVDLPWGGDALDLRDALQRQVRAGAITFRTPQFARSIRELDAAGGYPVGCAADFAECARESLAVYRATRNFFALHMVTATFAMRTCARLLDERTALATLTGSLLAAHKVVGSPSFDAPAPMPKRIDREHAYKYAYACLAEYRCHGDPAYVDELKALRAGGIIAPWAAADVVP